MNTENLAKMLANIGLFVLCIGSGGLLAWELVQGKPLDSTLLTFLSFVVGNYAKTIGFDQGSSATNKTIETVNGSAAKIAKEVVSTALQNSSPPPPTEH